MENGAGKLRKHAGHVLRWQTTKAPEWCKMTPDKQFIRWWLVFVFYPLPSPHEWLPYRGLTYTNSLFHSRWNSSPTCVTNASDLCWWDRMSQLPAWFEVDTINAFGSGLCLPSNWRDFVCQNHVRPHKNTHPAHVRKKRELREISQPTCLFLFRQWSKQHLSWFCTPEGTNNYVFQTREHDSSANERLICNNQPTGGNNNNNRNDRSGSKWTENKII